MGFRHVVLLQLDDATTAEQRDAIVAALRALPAKIPQLRSYAVGSDAGLAGDNYDLAVVADFDSPDDYATYRDHPDHQQVITELIRPVLTGRVAVQHATT
jgi:hypothetical protein